MDNCESVAAHAAKIAKPIESPFQFLNFVRKEIRQHPECRADIISACGAVRPDLANMLRDVGKEVAVTATDSAGGGGGGGDFSPSFFSSGGMSFSDSSSSSFSIANLTSSTPTTVVTPPTTASIPEPAPLGLVCVGIIALIGIQQLRRKRVAH